jgi:hypothetical protein
LVLRFREQIVVQYIDLRLVVGNELLQSFFLFLISFELVVEIVVHTGYLGMFIFLGSPLGGVMFPPPSKL